MNHIKLKDLVPGETAEVVGYAPCDPRYRSKLLSMGLTKRAVIQLIKTAPLGDPVEIEIRGFHLSLRKDEADVLLLERIPAVARPEPPGPGCCGEGPGRPGGPRGGHGRRWGFRRRLGRLFRGG